MRTMILPVLGLLLLPLPVLPDAEATVACGPGLVVGTATNAHLAPGEALAYGPQAAAEAFVARESATLDAYAECEGGVIYCLTEPSHPLCEVCQYVSVGSAASVNCCDYPPGDVPVLGSYVADCPSVVGEGACTSDGQVALGQVALETAAGTWYVDDRNYLLGNGIWIYEEFNNVRGLQRGGSSDVVPDDHEICHDDYAVADRLIF